ncbi:uncharacterized protein BYT42DRAFT_550076 [Radiomyces spectabilis]|uniref:uncharacterized protein n=1 Tax=Radiomyces spectabilis TaxID=64574 RepID=UPI00221ED931|nr:uncharacterized protein BYT42DRAFT_550076 [Radiomyces spectabilis]KAI8365172.1 hypothetical protein BYT42DRAFT_550076 [Radiomyces spectabilis]
MNTGTWRNAVGKPVYVLERYRKVSYEAHLPQDQDLVYNFVCSLWEPVKIKAWPILTVRLPLCNQGSKAGVPAELNYIVKFLTPIIGDLFKHHKEIERQWGDVVHDTLKQEEEALLKDNDARCKGLMPDGCVNSKNYGVMIALMEVSGLPNTKHHARLVGVKIKLAKMLKRLLKKVRRTLKQEGDADLYLKIKLTDRKRTCIDETAHGLYICQEEFHFYPACLR